MSRLEGLAVVVVAFGTSALLEQNLVPFSQQREGALVVVVDNRTDDAERMAMTSLAAAQGWVLVAPDTNLGFGEGNNAGVTTARERGATEVLLLNPDATITADDAALLLDAVRADPLALVGPRIVRPDGSMWSEGSDLYLDDGSIRSRRRRVAERPVAEWLTGACLLLSTGLWDRIGGFHPAYFLYWEDVDLSWAVRATGGTVLLVPEATAVHAEGGTQDGDDHQAAGGAKSPLYYYYNVRNRLVFAALRLDATTRRRWALHTARVSWGILLQGGRRQLRHPGRTLLPVARGLRDGRRLARELRRS